MGSNDNGHDQVATPTPPLEPTGGHRTRDQGRHRVINFDPARVMLVDVRLEIWGFTRPDAQMGLAMAMRAPNAYRWNVVGQNESIGPPCPIPISDPKALAQGAYYEWRWAAYKATEDTP